jgi:uncharacterized protein (DUF58 family)
VTGAGRFNGLMVGGVAAVTLAVARAAGSPLLARLALALALLLALSWAWSRLSLRGVAVERAGVPPRAQAGQAVVERLIVANRSRLSKLWVEVRDGSTLPGHDASRVVSLVPRGAFGWEVRPAPLRRGRYRLGPVSLHGGDPLGLFPRVRLLRETREVLVYPATADLPAFAPPGGAAPSGVSTRRPPRVAPGAGGVRAYQPGDPLGRINWRATARTGELMVKEGERDGAEDAPAGVWLLLDLEARRHLRAPAQQEGLAAGPLPPATEEYAVTAAAPLARHLLERARAVGLLETARRRAALHAAGGPEQLPRLLEALATARADGDWPLPAALPAQAGWLRPGDALLVITPSTDEQIAPALADLAGRGVACAVVLIDPATFGAVTSPLLLVAGLEALGVPIYLVRRGEDLGQALAEGRR